MQPDDIDRKTNLGDTIYQIGQTLSDLDPGALASLRRMSLEGGQAGAPYFWRLDARYDFGGDERRQTWARIVQIMAILTDKGRAEDKRSPHQPANKDNGWRGLGHALCDACDPAWGQGEIEPRPMLSELRFARLLAAREAMRAELIERTVRALAAKKPSGTGVNCTDLARFLLYPDDAAIVRKLARDYYARLDRGAANNNDDTDSSMTGDAA
ncbi:MAG: type I-E CRISPR-associated protein Cse2/CasB [Pseudomonadota bacterium]